MDWNWFFGALAQSTAAIVGLAGAFVFTRIVNNESEFNRKTDEFSRLLEQAKSLSNKAALLDFERYNYSRRDSGLSMIEEQIKGLEDDEEPYSPEEYLLILGFSEYDTVEELLALIEEKIAEVQEETQEPRSSSPAGILEGGLRMPSFPEVFTDTQTSIFHQERREERKRRIGEYRTEVENHADKVTRFVTEAKRNPQHSPGMRKIIGILVGLFLLGVVYPLGNLPFRPDGEVVLSVDAVYGSIISFQGLLLTLLTLLFLAIAGVLWNINEGLKHDPEELSTLADYEDPASYCPWFERMAEYEKWMAEMESRLMGGHA